MIQRQSTGLMGEQIPSDEQVYETPLIAGSISMVNQTHAQVGDGVYRRDVHVKAHGCIRAWFKVLPNLDAKYRFGVFKERKDYRAWVRFSSGNPTIQKDSEDDARGMAVKLTGVAGRKLLEGEEDADTQDFVMMNNPVYFFRNVPSYSAFAAALAEDKALSYFFNNWGLNPFRWHLREMVLAKKTLKPPPSSLLNTQFYSASAYKLGPNQFVKFSARPCRSLPVPGVKKSDPNYLREVMKQQLAAGGACFDFMIQLQVPGKNMPVEDPTVEWSGKDSPFVRVATVEIPKQEFDKADVNTFCENLSFNPWHSLPDHRPAGGLNRVRKALYQEVARYRRAKMNVPLDARRGAEPAGWCLDLTGAACPEEKPADATHPTP